MTVGCACIYKLFADGQGSIWTTALEFLVSVIIGICGVTVNYQFIMKLAEEKKNTLLHRKGNVIEPIMYWFLRFQIFYWPYHLLFFWMMFNDIIPSKFMTGWWCNVMFQIGIKFGRMYIAYNSLFVALIRYLYIVHHRKVDKWDYEKVRKWFSILSITVPILIEVIGTLTIQDKFFVDQEKYQACVADYQMQNSTKPDETTALHHKHFLIGWSMNVFSKSMIRVLHYIYNCITIVVALNIAECFLYLSINRCIKR